MENQFQPSFVPKRPIIPTDGSLRPRARTSFFMLIAGVLFLAALGATVALFAYNAVLTKTNADKENKINEAIRTFAPDLTKQLTVLKARIDTAKTLLQSHAALSVFLSLLSQNTAQTIRFKNFAYAVGADNKMAIAMKGESVSYEAVAFQSDVLSRNDNLQSVIFSNINLDETGMVGFNVKANIDPKSVSYQSAISATAATVDATTSAEDTSAAEPDQTSADTGTSTDDQTQQP